MKDNIELILAFNRERVSEKESAQESLFGMGGDSNETLVLNESTPAATLQKLIWEKELLGVYVSGHPLDAFTEELAKRPSIASIKQAVEEKNEMAIVQMKGTLATAGMVTTVRELLTKKGDRMAFVALADKKADIEMVVFPKIYLEIKDLLVPGTCIAIKGKLSIRNDEPSLMVDKAKLLSGQLTSVSSSGSEHT
jgi:DNA polymerase-3 subunit alpha